MEEVEEMEEVKEFQTRSLRGELKFFSNLASAVNEYKEFEEIWKISFDDMRWFPKRKNEKIGGTVFQSMAIEGLLDNLSSTYAEEQDGNALYFVQRDVISIEELRRLDREIVAKMITQEEYDYQVSTFGIKRVLTEEEFLEEFS